MRTPLRALLALALLALPQPAAAGDFSRAAVGTAGSEFLLLDAGARGTAMGGAMTAATDDAFSLYWNPAGLTRIPRLSASLMHADYVAGITYSHLAYAQRVSEASVLGAGLRYLDAGAIDQTNANAAVIGTFRPRSYAAELGWAQAVDDLSDGEMDVTMGVTGRYLHSELGGETAGGYAGDIGVQSRLYAASRSYDVGLALQNLGQGQKLGATRDTLPARLRLGGAVRPLEGLTLALEAVAPANDAPFGAAGAEYAFEFADGLAAAARAGFSSETYESLGALSTLHFGFGVAASNLRFDYAFVPMGALGQQTHRLSVSWSLPAKASRRDR